MEARKKQGMAENAEEVKQQMFTGVWFLLKARSPGPRRLKEQVVKTGEQE